MTFWDLPYASRRQPVLADNVVATSQPLAAQAGLAMLAAGGNAVDAAVAAAAALTVVEPTSNGIGSDLFALVWDGRTLHGLNASGRSPAALDPEPLLGAPMPLRGWDAVTVPGAVSGWVALHERFGTLDLEQLLAPAVAYADGGFAVSPITAKAWARAATVFAGSPDFAPFLPGGCGPAAGQRFAFPAQGRTLRTIAASGGDAFYRGALAERIAAHATAGGSPLSGEDLASHAADWVQPLAQRWADVVLHEIPPSGQGIAAQQALGLLAGTDITDHAPDSADAVHLQAEAMKLAFADAHRHVADPAHMLVEAAALLDPAYLRERAARIDPARVGDPDHGSPPAGGTVYLCTADADGRMVSLIQSNYYGFGSGVVVPDTGISLQNRGAGFSTERGHPNQLAPSKRPFHTIIPGFLTSSDGKARMAFGVMGGPMQPQGHVQMVLRTTTWGQNPQAASDAPRWRVESGRGLALEAGVDPAVRAELARRGHEISSDTDSFGFGGAQLIARTAGGWLAASDHRKDGQAAGF
ncbi:MAG: gamma-glutamyltransferase family protein [Actinomycetota bacterium]|jgi:gamma-glutamyltranspeptidase/glutathione hydrolase|nr:gamma-glutamyltransferase family protein [Euzebyaceae bacterium]MDQ3452169.1 gamma-glutamyltransferase family protein [Actinomycetota bacterium]